MAYVASAGGNFPAAIPDATEDPNIPGDLLTLANKIEKRVTGIYATNTARDAATTAMGGGEAGRFCYTIDTGTTWLHNGTTWVAFPPAQPVIRSGSAAPANTLGSDGDVY